MEQGHLGARHGQGEPWRGKYSDLCAGQRVEPGDVIVADDDGVVAVSRAEAAKVRKRRDSASPAEEEKRKRLAAGELGLDLYKMREKLAALGLEYR